MRLEGVIIFFFFSVAFNPIATNDILDILKDLMKRTGYNLMFWLIKKIFIELWTCLVMELTIKSVFR